MILNFYFFHIYYYTSTIKAGASLTKKHKKTSNAGFCVLGAVVEGVRTVFERRNDTTIYIPNFESVSSIGG